jgi:hypothetical protein
MNSEISKIVKVVSIADWHNVYLDIAGTIVLDIYKCGVYGKTLITATYKDFEYLVALSTYNGAKISLISSWAEKECNNTGNCNARYCNSLMCKGRNSSVQDVATYINEIGNSGFAVKLNISEEFQQFIISDKIQKKQQMNSPSKLEEQVVKIQQTQTSKIAWSEIPDEDEKNTSVSTSSSVSVTADAISKLEEKIKMLKLENEKKNIIVLEEFKKTGKEMDEKKIAEYWMEWLRLEDVQNQQTQKFYDMIQGLRDADAKTRKADEEACELAEIARKMIE